MKPAEGYRILKFLIALDLMDAQLKLPLPDPFSLFAWRNKGSKCDTNELYTVFKLFPQVLPVKYEEIKDSLILPLNVYIIGHKYVGCTTGHCVVVV
ncbi:MAG: hypothetical protein ACRBBN_04435 [Methyloligellaceae bacterium]